MKNKIERSIDYNNCNGYIDRFIMIIQYIFGLLIDLQYYLVLPLQYQTPTSIFIIQGIL